MARIVRPVDKKDVIQRLSWVVDGTNKVAMFNNVDVPLVKAIISKSKTTFTIYYGRSGIQVTLRQ